jgi:hypothetical protein
MQEVIPLLMTKGHTVTGIDNFIRYGARSSGCVLTNLSAAI